jgi:hypothetical protein
VSFEWGLRNVEAIHELPLHFLNWYGLVQFIGDLLTNVKEIPKIDLEPVKRFKNGL